MQLKKAVKEIILPVMERNNYTLYDCAPAYYRYHTVDDTLRVIVDKGPWAPPALRVDLKYRKQSGTFSHFELDQIKSYEDLDLFYSNQEELEAKLKIIAEILDTYALKFLESMRDNHVFWTREMDGVFASDPEKRANEYACANSLSLSFSLDNFKFLENQIALMRGDLMSNWRLNFNLHCDEIIGLASYYGEIIRLERCAKWDSGVLEFTQGRGYPYVDVVKYWNYELYIPGYRLVHHSLR